MYTVKEVPTRKKTFWKMVCSQCGSENVTTQAICSWSKKEQQWVYEDYLDSGYDYCSDCCDDITIDEVHITEVEANGS